MLLNLLCASFDSWGRSMGLSQSPRDKLEAFYMKHNPEKLKNPVFLDKTLRKWQGREEVLFKACTIGGVSLYLRILDQSEQ